MSDDVAVAQNEDAVEADGDDAVHDDAESAIVPRRGLRRRGAQISVVLGIVALTALPVAAHLASPDGTASADERTAVITAATEGTVAVLSYRADTVQSDVEGAKTHLTGDFLTYYSGFAEQSVIPGAIERGLTSSATVSGAALVSVVDTEAVALLFVDQNITATDAPDPRATSTSLHVALTRVDGRWLVSAVDPVQ